jgi:hypothetical protein
MKVIATATYMVYMEDDPSPDANPSDVSLERSSIPDLSVCPTVHSLTGATSHTGMIRPDDEIRNLKSIETVVYPHADSARTDHD